MGHGMTNAMSAKLHVERNKRPELWPLVTTSHFASSSSLRLSLSRALLPSVADFFPHCFFFGCSLLHFVVIRTQLGYRWLCSFPPQIKQTKSECFTCLFFFGLLGVPLAMELSFWFSFAAGDAIGGVWGVWGWVFFWFPKVGVDPNLVVLPSSWATFVYVFSSAAAAAFLPM
jgi:hypothetical protein